jgi:hypothetical protein
LNFAITGGVLAVMNEYPEIFLGSSAPMLIVDADWQQILGKKRRCRDGVWQTVFTRLFQTFVRLRMAIYLKNTLKIEFCGQPF